MKEDNITYEVCPHCGEEVELENELKVQKCPHCGKMIVACSMCRALDEGVENCCKNCPLEYMAHAMNGNVPKSYEVILHLDADIDEHIEAESAREALNLVLDKYRKMSDEELLKHIGYFRVVSNARVFDNETGECIISNEEYQL